MSGNLEIVEAWAERKPSEKMKLEPLAEEDKVSKHQNGTSSITVSVAIQTL